MDIPLNSSMDVFLFIIFCSFYVCSTLWLFGDAATRGAGNQGKMIPLAFVIAAALALVLGWYLALIIWPIGYVIWFVIRPKQQIELID